MAEISTLDSPSTRRSVKSFCRFCHVFCGIEVDVVDGKAVALRGDPDNPASRGYTCMKGRAELERLYHPDRLLDSHLRIDGELRPVPTSQALDDVAQRLRHIIAEHGPDSVAVYVGCGGHRSAAGGPWFVRRWLDGLGSNRLYTTFTIDSPSMIIAGNRLFGSPLPLMLLDIDHADVALFAGTNPLTSHFMSMPQPDPRRRLQDAKRRGMQLIVIDPRRSEVARMADHHLQVRPGEDASLIAGMIRIIIEDGLLDRLYVSRHASRLQDLAAAVKPFDLQYVSARTGVPAQQIREATVAFATAATGGAQTGTGIHMARHQNLTTQLVMTLNVLCGRYDRRGGLTRQAGVVNMAIPELDSPITMPTYEGPVSRIRDIPGSYNWLGFFEELPTNTLTDEILTPGDGQIRALIVHGGNPALVFPDANSTAKALESLDLLVVDELFMTATARRAHAVLPVAHPLERTDIPKLMDFSYPFAFSQYTTPVVEAPPEVLEDWEVFWELAERLDFEIDLPALYRTEGAPGADGIVNARPKKRPSTDDVIDALFSNSRIPIAEIRSHPDGHVWGDHDPIVGGIVGTMAGHDANPMAIGHPEVIAELAQVRDEPQIPGGGFVESEEFAFRLITYRMKEVYCSQGHNLPSLARRRTFNPVLMNPASVEAIGASDGARVLIDSGYGQVEGTIEATDDVVEGVVACSFGWGDPDGGTNVQYLIPDDARFDPVSGLAQQSAVPVNVIPVAG